MGKRRKNQYIAAHKLKAEYHRGNTAGYAEGRKAAGVAPLPPIRYERGAYGKWYVRLVGDKNEVKN